MRESADAHLRPHPGWYLQPHIGTSQLSPSADASRALIAMFDETMCTRMSRCGGIITIERHEMLRARAISPLRLNLIRYGERIRVPIKPVIASIFLALAVMFGLSCGGGGDDKTSTAIDLEVASPPAGGLLPSALPTSIAVPLPSSLPTNVPDPSQLLAPTVVKAAATGEDIDLAVGQAVRLADQGLSLIVLSIEPAPPTCPACPGAVSLLAQGSSEQTTLRFVSNGNEPTSSKALGFDFTVSNVRSSSVTVRVEAAR